MVCDIVLTSMKALNTPKSDKPYTGKKPKPINLINPYKPSTPKP